MSEFGDLFRAFRQQSKDPQDRKRILSQGRLGELLGMELGIDRGFSAAAVSDWERGKSKIHADERNVLISVVKVLHAQGGIRNLAEANRLLESGNYRALNAAEMGNIFLADLNSLPGRSLSNEAQAALLNRFFTGPNQKLRELIVEAQEGPPPAWPRVMAALLREATDGLSFSLAAKILIWVWMWLFTWILIAPSLHWPFVDQDQASLGIGLYVAASLIFPLLIGALTNTRDNPFWQEQALANSSTTRLYVYQGAGIGFNLGYFIAFAISLLVYFLQFRLPLWLELIAAALPLVMGNMAARVVPYNLWLAYGRLNLKDGWIFFVVALIGPFWGFFFIQVYSTLLAPASGVFVILTAVTMFVIVEARRARRNTDN